MTAWWPHHIKHHKQLEFYHNYVWDKCSYSVFFARIHQQWLSYEEAIKPETLKWKHNIKTKYDEEWRVCVKCLEYKTRDKFHKNRVWLHNRTSDCINCRNKAKREYRKRTNCRSFIFELYDICILYTMGFNAWSKIY